MLIKAIIFSGNSADIIELSIRHNLTKVDEILVLDNDSTDGSVEILEKLCDEYKGRLNVIYTKYSNTKDYLITTNFFKEKIKASESAPDFLFCLDADEFIHAENFDELLTIPDNHVGIIKWKCYIPNKIDHKNYPVEMTDARSSEPEYAYKVIIPKNVNGMLMLGSHFLHYDDKRVPSVEMNSMYLAHYPVRSIEQINSKIKFATEFAKDEDNYQVFHLRNIKKIESLDELINMAINYGFNND